MGILSRIASMAKEQPPAKIKISDEKVIKSQYKYWRIRMFLSMYFGYVLFYFTRKNLSPVLHVFAEDRGYSLTQVGILGSVMYVTYGIGKFVSGALADKANIRFFLSIGLFLASICNFMFARFESLWALSFFWGLNGIFQSMGFPPIAKGLVFWFSAKERATKWTLWSSSHTAGTFLVGILAAWLLKNYGWKSAFYVPSLIGIVGSVFLWVTLRDRPVSQGLPTIEEFKNEPPPVVNVEKANMTQWEVLKKYVFTNVHIWSLAFAYIFVYVLRFGTLDWATPFLYQDRGIPKAEVAFLWSFMPLLGMPGGVVAGYIADKFFDGRCTPINVIYLVLLGLSIFGFYTVASPEKFGLTCFFLACIGFFVDGPQNLVGGVQVSRVTVKEATSAAVGFVGLFGYIGAIVSGVGLGYIADNYGWRALFGFCIFTAIMSIFLVMVSYKKEFSKDSV